MTAQCNGSNNTAEILNWLNNNGFATASEDCGNIIWTNNYGSIATDCGTMGGVTKLRLSLLTNVAIQVQHRQYLL